MPVFSSLISALYFVADSVLSLYFWIVIASVVLSWVNPDPYNPIVRAIRNLTEPVFYRVREWLPFTYVSGLDFSPFLIVLAIKFAQVFLGQLVRQLLYS